MNRNVASKIIMVLLLMGTLTLAFKIQLGRTEPTTIVVPDDYPTIQEAINNANEGDTVFVKEGTYYENFVLNKTISLVGQKKDTTVVDGNNSNVIVVTADSVQITNLTVRNGGSEGIGIFLNYTLHCIIENVHSLDNWPAIHVDHSQNVTVSGVSTYYTAILGSRCGILLTRSDNNTVTNSYIKNIGVGISLQYSHDNIVVSNDVPRWNVYVGIELLESSRNLIDSNSIGADIGIQLVGSSNNRIVNNDLSAGFVTHTLQSS